MRFLSFIILFSTLLIGLPYAQSPHGEDLKLDCSLCHNPNNWQVDKETITFEHSMTRFSLVGQHEVVDCQSCHASMVFTKAESYCNSCHIDFHQETVGLNCSECHTPKSWMVEDINGLHQKSRFPLVGKHLIADCVSCHPRYLDLYFGPLNIDCYSCHELDYNSTTAPNHTEAGFSTECQDCHDINAETWTVTNIIHDFFPLVGGHTIPDCFSCHEQGGDFTGLSQDCFSCHEQDYNSVEDPNHVQNNFTTDCTQCHTIFGWQPTTYDHNQTNFPQTGAHVSLDCSACHADGFAGTPTDCYSCHQQDYESVIDPNHVTNNYSFDCTQCHNTDSWSTTSFDHNLTAFELTGAHLAVDCANCHQTGYEGTSTDCFSCHDDDYNNSVNPDHQAAGFPTMCEDCHSTLSWAPAIFDHDVQYFPIFSGRHAGAWDMCINCHEVPGDYSVFSCITCHEHRQSEMDDRHVGVQGYLYESNACYSCHPTGEKEGAFDHSLSEFPLTGAHTALECQQCHQSGFPNTPIDCVACHQQDYSQSTNPNHEALVIPTECNSCHTTDPTWQPASFGVHNQFYELIGAHANISNNCITCHNGDYNNTTNTCFGCHESEYNATNNPPHPLLNFSHECMECHNQNIWIPANFNHDFYSLSGDHTSFNCNECHSDPGYQPQCLSCHLEDYIDRHKPGDPIDCWNCHTNFDWSDVNRGFKMERVD